MTESERKAVVVRAGRNVRRAYRQADSAGEILERTLDRLLSRKTRITPEQALKVDPLYKNYRDKVGSVERALTDFFQATYI